jgi:hypothetical protein
MSLFEKASRIGLRFDTLKGAATVEDLWLLPLTSTTGAPNLDKIAQDLDAQLRNAPTVSFVHKETKNNDIPQMKFDIVRHIINIRLEENKLASDHKQNSEKKQEVLAIIAQKKNAAMMDMKVEELEELAQSL